MPEESEPKTLKQVHLAEGQTGHVSSSVVVITPKFDKDGKPTKESWLDSETFEGIKHREKIAEFAAKIADLEAKIAELENPKPEEPKKLKHVVIHDNKDAKDPVEIIPKVRASI